ncbi:predicted protein [Botrytis cinerea T4]|uniref:Uncharacterized protein n=1 Tax=Botryotinia fuckeliana (strain T4) TaxID=999810 RepID=G2YJV8_BOTF4|nr:predicted protein [Botrytis cinerea T4]
MVKVGPMNLGTYSWIFKQKFHTRSLGLGYLFKNAIFLLYFAV